jgi:hypothetical protein
MAPQLSGNRGSVIRTATRQQISNGLFYVGFIVMVTVTSIRYLADGSLWVDEAAVAQSFRDLDLPQVFDRLIGSQSFPRWYFLLVKSAKEIFGYETMVLRFFPFVFSALATFLFLRLFRLRFALYPSLLLSAIALNLIPASWFVYSAFIKQYSFDVFLALLPFCLNDEFFEETLGRRERRYRLILLCLPCALSMTYIIPMLGRVGGWAGMRLGRDWRLGAQISPGGAALFVSSTLVFLASLWITDLRFTLGQQSVVEFHSDYILGSDWNQTKIIAHRLVMGWYTGKGEFHTGHGLPMGFLRTFELLTLIGVARILWDSLRRGRPSPEAPTSWGSRSLGSLVTIFGLVVASPVMQFPLQEGRMTLFLLFHLQIVLLEGLSFLYVLLCRRIPEHYAALPLSLIFAAILIPPAALNTHAMATRNPPSNLRPLLPKIARYPGLKVLVTMCSEKQVETLPEGLGEREILYLPILVDVNESLGRGEEVLVINAFESKACKRYLWELEALALESLWLSGEDDTAQLLWLRLPDQFPDLKIGPRMNHLDGTKVPGLKKSAKGNNKPKQARQ